jgi:hypothetical protein
MSTLERRLADELRRRAGDLPPAMGNLERVRRAGRLRLMASRLTSLAVLTAVAVVASLALTGRPATGTPAADGGAAVEDLVALTPVEATTLTVQCLRGKGLVVEQDEEAIQFRGEDATTSMYDEAFQACQNELRRAGYLLPEDNPEYLRVGYAQYLALAECYRAAGIDVPEAPPLEDFVAARRADIPTWSPQQAAIRIAGFDAAMAAEEGCVLPTPEEVWAGDE